MLSLTLVALSRGQTLWLETDMRGASVQGACKRYVARPSSDMQSLPQSPHSGQQALSTPCRGHLDPPLPMCFCSPNEGFRSTTSPLLPGNFGKLCSASYSQQQEMGLRGWFGACYTVIKWDCLGERRRRRRWSIMFCRAFHCSIVAFFVFVRADFDAVSPYLCSPGSHVS